MRVIEVVIKSIIILVVLLTLCAGESIASYLANVINGDLFIGCICVVIIAITIMSIVKSNKAKWSMSDYYEVNGEDSIEINEFTEALLDWLES